MRTPSTAHRSPASATPAHHARRTAVHDEALTLRFRSGAATYDVRGRPQQLEPVPTRFRFQLLTPAAGQAGYRCPSGLSTVDSFPDLDLDVVLLLMPDPPGLAGQMSSRSLAYL